MIAANETSIGEGLVTLDAFSRVHVAPGLGTGRRANGALETYFSNKDK